MKKPEKARSMTPEPSPAAPGVKAEDQPIKPDELQMLLGSFEEMEPKKLHAFMQAFTAVFPLPPNGRVSETITSTSNTKPGSTITSSAMADGKTKQAVADDKRRSNHFQVRLDSQLAEQLRHYAEQRHHGVINMALSTIISKFFNGK